MRVSVLLFIALSTLSILCLGFQSTTPQSKQSEYFSEPFDVLSNVSSGKAIIQKAKAFLKLKSDDDLLQIFKIGNVSKTDAVLIRHVNPGTGVEYREREITIFIRKDQGINDLVLDLAHELTHASNDPKWDPYDPRLTAGGYIWNTIEGAGGEVDALFAECSVGKELKIISGVSAERCARYYLNGKLAKNLIKQDLYKVGKWNREIIKRLGLEVEKFPDLSGAPPQLFSSTGHAPYPIALLNEYLEITMIACSNSRKRLETLQNRELASVYEMKESVTYFLEQRCLANYKRENEIK